MQSKINMLAFLLISALASVATQALAQESVAVPQRLRQDVRAFRLSMGSLDSLQKDLHKQNEAVMRELKVIQQQMELVPRGSRSYHLYRSKYEAKLSQYWAGKHAMLQEMQTLRRRTLTSLNHVLMHLQTPGGQADAKFQQNLQSAMRAADDKIAATQLQMLQILDKLKDSPLSFEERHRLTRKFQILQNEGLRLQEMHRRRIARLQKKAGTPDRMMPAARQALLLIKDDLENRYDWIETEISYLQLHAELRRKQLETDEKMVELSGLMEEFSRMVNDANSKGSLMAEIEGFENELRSVPDTTALVQTLPGIEWPGKKMFPVDIKEFSPAQIDSLQAAIQARLKTTSPGLSER